MEKTSIEIVKQLKSHGFEAYWAGGTVRDLLMGYTPKDYDIVTSAKPDEIEDILEHTVPIGKKFGVILAIKSGHHFEVATFRSDASYTDGRRPDAIYFTNAEEDALRRDFTVNGMFYDPINKKVLDFVGGQRDLKNKTLRFIGNPDERIKEDNLRILRAIRFKNALGLKYAPQNFAVIKKNAHLINNVSKERICDELTKTLMLPGREDAMRELGRAGILKYILPELLRLKGIKQPEKYHKEGDVFEHTIMSLEALPDRVSKTVAWATLLHDIGKPDTFSVKGRIRFDRHAEVGAEIVDKIARRLKFSTKLREDVKWIVKHHMILGDIPKMKRTKQIRWIFHPLFPKLLRVLKADILGSKPRDLSLYHYLKDFLRQKEEKLLPEPQKLITGGEVISKFHLKPGPEIGKILQKVHHAQLDEKIRTKKEALEYVKRLLKK